MKKNGALQLPEFFTLISNLDFLDLLILEILYSK